MRKVKWEYMQKGMIECAVLVVLGGCSSVHHCSELMDFGEVIMMTLTSSTDEYITL